MLLSCINVTQLITFEQKKVGKNVCVLLLIVFWKTCWQCEIYQRFGKGSPRGKFSLSIQKCLFLSQKGSALDRKRIVFLNKLTVFLDLCFILMRSLKKKIVNTGLTSLTGTCKSGPHYHNIRNTSRTIDTVFCQFLLEEIWHPCISHWWIAQWSLHCLRHYIN